jgi:hypothetical protein
LLWAIGKPDSGQKYSFSLKKPTSLLPLTDNLYGYSGRDTSPRFTAAMEGPELEFAVTNVPSGLNKLHHAAQKQEEIS